MHQNKFPVRIIALPAIRMPVEHADENCFD